MVQKEYSIHYKLGLLLYFFMWDGTQCSKENAGKYDRNYDTCLYLSTQAVVQMQKHNGESTMGARCSRSAYTPLLRRLHTACASSVKQALNLQ